MILRSPGWHVIQLNAWRMKLLFGLVTKLKWDHINKWSGVWFKGLDLKMTQLINGEHGMSIM